MLARAQSAHREEAVVQPSLAPRFTHAPPVRTWSWYARCLQQGSFGAGVFSLDVSRTIRVVKLELRGPKRTPLPEWRLGVSRVTPSLPHRRCDPRNAPKIARRPLLYRFRFFAPAAPTLQAALAAPKRLRAQHRSLNLGQKN